MQHDVLGRGHQATASVSATVEGNREVIGSTESSSMWRRARESPCGMFILQMDALPKSVTRGLLKRDWKEVRGGSKEWRMKRGPRLRKCRATWKIEWTKKRRKRSRDREERYVSTIPDNLGDRKESSCAGLCAAVRQVSVALGRREESEVGTDTECKHTPRVPCGGF